MSGGVIRNLILAGGVSHPFEETAPALAALLRAHGIQSDIAFDIEEGLARLDGCDLLTVHCLRWTMTQHEKYAPSRAQWAFSLSESARASIRSHVARGRGIFGVHTAPISFDDWPEWIDMLGLAWRWGRSHHPPYGAIDARSAREGLSPGADVSFTVADELYCDLDIAAWMRPFAEARHPETGDWQPLAFAGENKGARRAYHGLGHDLASIEHPDNARLLARAARWAARLSLD